MTALVYGIVHSGTAGWGNAQTIGTIVVGLALLALFILNERRAQQPVMPPRLFANRERVGAYATRFLFLGGMVPFWFFATNYLQLVEGFSPVLAGLAFLPVTLPNFASAMAVPRLTRRFGNGRLLVGGLLISVVGMGWLSHLSAYSGYLTGVALPMILIGIGQGGCLAPLTSAGIVGVAAEDAGAAGGVVNVAHQIGGSVGLGVTVAVFTAVIGAGTTNSAALAHAEGVSLMVATAMPALSLLTAVALIVRPATASRAVPAPAADHIAEASALPQLPARPAHATHK